MNDGSMNDGSLNNLDPTHGNGSAVGNGSILEADELDRLRTTAERLASKAGQLALAGRAEIAELRSDSAQFDTKSSATDLVTAYDQAAERAIVDWLRTHRPDDGIVGEEGTSVAGQSGLEWHIDPIDGTTNYVFGQPAWACSVGVASAAGTLAGAVYAPVLDEMFSAAVGRGATCNGVPIRVNDTTNLGLALAATGFSFRAERRELQGRLLAEILPRVRDIRRLGAAAIDLCYVACGRLDAYFESGLNSWDMLAGELIATEAGAITSRFDGSPPVAGELLVAAPEIHHDLVGLLSDWSAP